MRPSDSQRGYMLLLVPVIVIAICLMGYRMASRSKTAMRLSATELDNLQVKLGSQQCVSVAANRVQAALEGSLPVPTGESACAAGIQGGDRLECATEIGEAVERTRTSCYGYRYQSTEVDVASRCRDAAGSSTLEEKVAYGEIPLFQFAVFYDRYLATESSTNIEFRGLVHSNDTIAFGPSVSMSVFDWVTTPKAVLVHNGWQNGTGDGPINRLYFTLANGTLDGTPIRPVSNEFTSIVGEVPGWSAWKKRHRIAFGGEPNGCGEVKPLRLPVRGLADNIALIDRKAGGDTPALRRQKFAWKASLLYDGAWHDQDGNPAAFPADPAVPPAAPAGWETRDVNGRTRVALWNGREQLMTLLVPLDVARLQLRSAADSIIHLYDHLRDPGQGNRVTGGFLLHNGSRLTRPLTIVANTRLVVLGDFNSDSAFVVSGKRYPFPAALVSDHMSVLTNEFVPGEHTWGRFVGTKVTVRNPAARLVLNTCIMTGFSYIGGTVNDWGGHGNVLRFEEDWDGTPLDFSGSVVCIWSPHHAQAAWQRPGPNYYYAPERLFSNSDLYATLGKMPPGTPRVVAPGLLDWEMVRN